MQILQSRWNRVLQPYNVDNSTAQTTFDQLIHAYTETGRYYHTLEHIANIFAVQDSLALSLSDADLAVLELAAWYHDVIYDAKVGDNEEKSAILAKIELERLHIPAVVIAHTCQIVLDTKTHQPTHNQTLNQVFLDLDLSILGADATQYDRYSHAIRQEYAYVPEAAYRTGRKAVLQKFVHRARIYFTDIMYNRFEAQARHNLHREIGTL